jgi:endonuclease III related protein
VTLASALAALASSYGPRGWWPLPSRKGESGRDDLGYARGPSRCVGPGGNDRDARDRFEIALGAVLAQNTAWRGASLALAALGVRGLLSPKALLACPLEELELMLLPAGTYARKAAYLRTLAAAWPAFERSPPEREELLALRGVGYETADCIGLYCYGVGRFVADAYARRILGRLGFTPANAGYETVRLYAEGELPADASYLAEAHALLVEHAKRRCKAKPLCEGCPLGLCCAFKRSYRG